MGKTKNQIWPWLIVGLLAVSAKFAQAAPEANPPTFERVEVPIGHVFIPPKGYDDNDNIQFVLDGILPNGCYTVANEEAHADPVSKQITAHLFALHRTDTVCADESQLPKSLVAPVPYTLEVSMGSLPAGPYRIVYPRPGLTDGLRSFQIDKALSLSVDAMPYAATSSVWIPDTVRGDLEINAELIGSLTSSCSFLSPEVSVKLIDDVFVVLQSLGFQPNVPCPIIMIPFQRTIKLGKVGEGRYLIHVRSMDGRSVNRAFSAVIPDP